MGAAAAGVVAGEGRNNQIIIAFRGAVREKGADPQMTFHLEVEEP